jgi:hypothetical protein
VELVDPAQRAMLEAAWDAVDRAWEDDGAHRRLLALADSLDALPWVASRYRACTTPERRDVARAQGDRIVALALVKLGKMKTSQSDGPRTVVLVTRVLSFVFLLCALAFAASVMFDCESSGRRDTLHDEEQARPHAARLQSP